MKINFFICNHAAVPDQIEAVSPKLLLIPNEIARITLQVHGVLLQTSAFGEDTGFQKVR
jgi:hypothetical protein